jgi:hypothetical protein
VIVMMKTSDRYDEDEFHNREDVNVLVWAVEGC